MIYFVGWLSLKFPSLSLSNSIEIFIAAVLKIHLRTLCIFSHRKYIDIQKRAILASRQISVHIILIWTVCQVTATYTNFFLYFKVFLILRCYIDKMSVTSVK